MKEPGYDVLLEDKVEVNGIFVNSSEKKAYIVLNKPKGYVTTMDDDRGRLIVANLVENIPERIVPVGRLDYNTTGLLLMTNDGELTNKLTHPRHEVGKTYRATVAGVLSREKQNRLEKGVDIGDFTTSPAQVEVVKQTERSAIVDITIHEGKNRQVRKMFKTVGCPVQDLDRIAMGELRLGRLGLGHYRKLTKQEIEYLKNL